MKIPKPVVSSPVYEPTSVLDPHITSSPSPAFLFPPHSLPPLPLSSSDDDFPSFLLPDFDDPPVFFPDPSPAPYLPHLDLLLRAAHSLQIPDPNASLQFLIRLDSLPSSSPLHRSVSHFKDALLALLPVPNPPLPCPPLSPLQLVRRIAAHKSFSDLSPIAQFASFTANQTLLESLHSSPSIRLIDFDLGLGGQWSSFAHDLAARSRAARIPPPFLRITAVVSDQTAETSLAADNLRDFGRAVGLRIELEFVRLDEIGGVRISGSEAVAVVLTPAILRMTGVSVLRFVRRAAPRVVLVVDGEGCGGGGSESFRRRIAEGAEYFAAAMEVVEAGAAATGAGEEAVRRIENALFRPRIFAAVAAAVGTAAGDWREAMGSAGLVVEEMSEFTESQAEWLLRRLPVEGFHVARREAALVLSWKGREMAATSAWSCR